MAGGHWVSVRGPEEVYGVLVLGGGAVNSRGVGGDLWKMLGVQERVWGTLGR